MKAAVHQLLATLGYGDAIGHEVLAIRRALRSAGYESEIFVEAADPRLEPATVDYRRLVDCSHADNLIIHHFSLASRASRTGFALPDRMALVYHNITPPEFFVGLHRSLSDECYRGRRELRAYATRCDLALGDSEFNRQDLESLGFPRTAVLPVVPDFAHLDLTPDRRMAGEFDDEWVNLLFVGRMVPNKKIEDVIRFFDAYHRFFNPRSRLLLVGAQGGFDRYVASLHQVAAALGNSHVHLVGHVSERELVAFYEMADLFLCASEHEGFCVPIVEAFYTGVPVVAYAATAVPSTMDGAGVLFSDKDPVRVAAIINAVLSDATLQDAIVEGQLEAVARLRAKDFDGTLLRFVEQILSGPRAPRPHVTPDFWQQFDMREALEDIRLARPSLFHALPRAPRP